MRVMRVRDQTDSRTLHRPLVPVAWLACQCHSRRRERDLDLLRGEPQVRWAAAESDVVLVGPLHVVEQRFHILKLQYSEVMGKDE